jgi:g-D-glutamyl-meso-diaminopimelate peptidase
MKYKPLVEEVSDNTDKWQANARGVDINHNFNAGWCTLKERELSRNIKCPSPTRFGGNCPESEPETKALTGLCQRTDFERAIALHSQGREIYCSFGKHTPVLSFRLASVFSQASGYNIGFPEEIATGGGFKDWFIEKFRRPALTIEMGLGENPLPLSDFEEEYEILKSILCLGVVV